LLLDRDTCATAFFAAWCVGKCAAVILWLMYNCETVVDELFCCVFMIPA
jgi:hypothetical protein